MFPFIGNTPKTEGYVSLYAPRRADMKKAKGRGKSSVLPLLKKEKEKEK